MRIGLLSTVVSPWLPPTIATLHQVGVTDLVLLLDQKLDTEKDLAIWRERTGGYFERLSDIPPNIYGFTKNLPPAYFVPNHNGPICADLIQTLGVGLLVNAGTPRKLGPALLNGVPHGVLNVHPGILPKYRGCSCVEWAIYNDDPVGNTAHFMGEGYDDGPIVEIKQYEIPPGADYVTIRSQIYHESFVLMARSVKTVIEKSLTPAQMPPQPEGQYWSPIPADKMAEAMRKISLKAEAAARSSSS